MTKPLKSQIKRRCVKSMLVGYVLLFVLYSLANCAILFLITLFFLSLCSFSMHTHYTTISHESLSYFNGTIGLNGLIFHRV